MRKLMMILVMMLVASGVNAQSKKQKTVQKDNMYAVKQAALDALKRSLIAPSQFVLTDYKGNRIGVNGIETPMHIKGSELKEWSDSAYFYKGNKWTFRDKFDDEEPDSIWVYKVVQKPSSSYYAVKIIGDARNRAGGYEQISRIVFVYGKAPYFYGSLDVFRPHIERYHVGTIVCEKKVKKEKSVEDLFERIENVEYRKAAEREREQRLKSERFKEKIQIEVCEKFANKLRLDGVDITKLTDEDIERLDSIRIQHRKADPYYISLLDENEVLYNLPSRIFKYVMLKEMRYYAKIKSGKQEYYCNADSTVFVEPGLYQYCSDNEYGTTSKTLRYDGDRITIGRATFICKNKVIKNKVKKSKKKVADAEDDVYYLGKYDSSEGYHYRNSYSDYSARANFFSSMFRLTGNAGWLLNF